jgi:hypothetical protein
VGGGGGASTFHLILLDSGGGVGGCPFPMKGVGYFLENGFGF